MNDQKFRLKQETIAIIGLVAVVLYSVYHVDGRIDGLSTRIDHLGSELRAEMRAEREAGQARAQALRESVEASARADREQFTREILRLTANQARLSASLDPSGG